VVCKKLEKLSFSWGKIGDLQEQHRKEGVVCWEDLIHNDT
jgi:hypothetical protein